MEVRFENLHIETEVYAETSRQLPSLWNAVRASVEVIRLLSWQRLSCRQLLACRPAGCDLQGSQSIAPLVIPASFLRMACARAVAQAAKPPC